MANCARCAVERIIKGHPVADVLEIIGTKWYRILVRVQGGKFELTIAVLSENHSKDEDCSLRVSNGKFIEYENGRRIGIPHYRAFLVRYFIK